MGAGIKRFVGFSHFDIIARRVGGVFGMDTCKMPRPVRRRWQVLPAQPVARGCWLTMANIVPLWLAVVAAEYRLLGGTRSSIEGSSGPALAVYLSVSAHMSLFSCVSSMRGSASRSVRLPFAMRSSSAATDLLPARQ